MADKGVMGRDFLQENKGDAIAWAKQRRAKAQAAAQKRAERKQKEEAALKAQQEYESQIEQYKQRGFAPSSAFQVNNEGTGAKSGPPVTADGSSWEDTPIGSAVKPVRRQSASRSIISDEVLPRHSGRRRYQKDGPFGYVPRRLPSLL